MIEFFLYFFGIIILGILALFIYAITITGRPSLKVNSTTPDDLGMKHEDIFINSDKYKIAAWHIPSKEHNPDIIIMVHGWGHNASYMLDLAKYFYDNKYSLLIINLKGHGESDRPGYASMYNFRNDILSSVNHAKEKLNSGNVFLFGYSMGGACSLVSLADSKHVKASIICSSFACTCTAIKRSFVDFRFMAGLLAVIVVKFFGWYAKGSPESIEPQKQIAKVSTPLLLLHGKDDDVIPFSDFEALMNNADRRLVKGIALEKTNHRNILESDSVKELSLKFFKNIQDKPLGVGQEI